MSNIISAHGKEILDSRGNPTVYAEVLLEDGTRNGASVPSGASTGAHEAVEMRDGDSGRYRGKGVQRAVNHVNASLNDAVTGIDANDQRAVDAAIIAADGTPNKSRIGANATLAVSMAVLRASSRSRGDWLFDRVAEELGEPEINDERGTSYLTAKSDEYVLPVPLLNIFNGGAHAAGSTEFQEFMVVPAGLDSLSDALRAGSEIYQALGELLQEEGLSTTVGFEGGYAPVGLTNHMALGYVTHSIEIAGYVPGEQVFIALDPAASEFYVQPANRYSMKREGKRLTSEMMVEEYDAMTRQFPICSIEDGLAETDWDGWTHLTSVIGDRVQLVGDDLFVTQDEFLRRGIKEKAANAILIKPNQVGTVSETLDTIKVARTAGFSVVVSHRSGETEDTTIADLAVGSGCGQIKSGAPARSERVAKYNRLLRIEEWIGDRAKFAGMSVVKSV